MDDSTAGPLEPLISFGRQLRDRGLPVGTGRILTFCRTAAALGVSGRQDLYWAGRASLIASRDHIDAFDAAFDDWYRSISADPQDPVIEAIELDLPSLGDLEELSIEAESGAPSGLDAIGEGEDPGAAGETTLRVVASASETLRSKPFANLTDEERARVSKVISHLTFAVPTHRTRRTRPSAKGAFFDLRRTLRGSLRTQGEPFERAWRDRRSRTRPLVLILDVSGSMAPYSRALLQFGYAAMAAGRRVEVFCFGTRLTRVTRTLRTKDPDRALHEIGRLVADWEGGTRIGESLKTLLDGWSQRTALRGAVVVLCSDGLERGDPDLLRAQMARLRRLAHRVVWANPLKGSPRYQPLARGMAAALPSVDAFLSGHNLESLEELAKALGS